MMISASKHKCPMAKPGGKESGIAAVTEDKQQKQAPYPRGGRARNGKHREGCWLRCSATAESGSGIVVCDVCYSVKWVA